MQTFFRYLATLIAAVAALAVAAASCGMNFIYWAEQGRTAQQAVMIGTVFVAFDVIKSLSPLMVGWALTAQRYVYAIIASTFFAMTFVVAIISAIGFVSSNRSAISGTQVIKTANLELAKKEAQEIEFRISGYPKSKAPAQIEAELEALRTNYRWRSTKECSDATVTTSRAFCVGYAEKKAALAQAVAHDRDNRRLAQLRVEIKRLLAAGAGQEANPQAAMLARLLPDANTSDAEFLITVAVAIMVEVGAALGLFLALGHWPNNRNPELKRKPVTQVTEIEPVSSPTAIGMPIRLPDTSRVQALMKPDDLNLTDDDLIALRDWGKRA